MVEESQTTDVSADSKPKTIKIEHRKSSDYLRAYALRTFTAGPMPDGTTQIIFFSPAIDINYDHLDAVSGAHVDLGKNT